MKITVHIVCQLQGWWLKISQNIGMCKAIWDFGIAVIWNWDFGILRLLKLGF